MKKCCCGSWGEPIDFPVGHPLCPCLKMCNVVASTVYVEPGTAVKVAAQIRDARDNARAKM